MTYQLKGGSILNDMDKTIAENRKVFLLDWLFRFGHEPVYRYKLWEDKSFTDSVITLYFNWALHYKYINQERDENTMQFTHAITDKAMEFLNKGELNEQ
jgi:hypothetical protein